MPNLDKRQRFTAGYIYNPGQKKELGRNMPG
jgi:hypothetical protein